MKFKLITLTVLVLFFYTLPSIAQDVNLARGYYIKAKEYYAAENYQETINYLKKATDELGATNPDILYLEVLSRYKLDESDEKISSLGKEFMNNAYEDDRERVQEISLIIVEYQEKLDAKLQAENQLYNQILESRNLSSVKSYLERYPNADESRINTIKSIYEELQNERYLSAKEANRSENYSRFLSDFPKSSSRSEIENLLTKALEEELYEKAKNANNLELYKAYLDSYHNGRHSEEISDLLKSTILDSEDSSFFKKNFEVSREYYKQYKTRYPNGERINYVNDRLKEIDKSLQKEEIIKQRSADKSYILGFYSLNEIYGIEFGGLRYDNISSYLTISGKKLEELSFSNDEESSTLTTEDLEVANLGLSYGINHKIFYPIWVYGGAGVLYSEFFDVDTSTSYKLEDVNNISFYPELGVNIILGDIALLKAGITYIRSEINFTGGIGFQL